MVTYVAVVKGTNKGLAIAELKSLWMLYFQEDIILVHRGGCMYTFTSSHTPTAYHTIWTRLTLTNYVGAELYRGSSADKILQKATQEVLLSYYRGSCAIRIRKANRLLEAPYDERELAEMVWDLFTFKKPLVDLKSPRTEFTFMYYAEQDVGLSASLFINDKAYLNRMPKQRPVNMPYTLKSDMSRAAVNLLRLRNGVIADPFCGVGGIAIEGIDMQFHMILADISRKDLEHVKTNVEYFYPNNGLYLLVQGDIRHCCFEQESLDGIVTDIPYGRASRRKGMESVYDAFLQVAARALKPKKRLVVIYANFIPFKDLALKYFDEVMEIEQYINASMTRYILVLERPKSLKKTLAIPTYATKRSDQ